MNFRQRIDKILEFFLVVLMGTLVINVVWQVLSRFVFKNPSSFTDELATFLLIWVGLAGAAYVKGKNEHLAIDILPPKLNPVNRIRLRIFINVLIILFSLTVLVIGGGNLVYVNNLLGQSSAALNIPLSWVYSVVPLSGILVIVYKVNEIIFRKKYLI